MSTPPTSSAISPEPPAPQTEYPFTTSPDILRIHQKDAYLTGILSTDLATILRNLLGARVAYKYANTTNHVSELLYLCITTLIGNRTLGEEYCDVIQIENDTLRLAGLGRRLGYIMSVVFAPWILGKTLPALRRKLRMKLERSIDRRTARQPKGKSVVQSRTLKIQEYILRHLDTLTSLNPIYALSLATFYFSGSYYHISKRIFGLRYIFTKHLKPGEQRAGYEVLGVLLILQMLVQSTLHIRETYLSASMSSSSRTGEDEDEDQRDGPDTTLSSRRGSQSLQPLSAMVGPGIEIPLPTVSNSTTTTFNQSPDQLLADIQVQHRLPRGLSAATSTPILEGARYDLSSSSQVMAWISDPQQRKCTLCLEPFKDPSVTTCGHVFCWTCVQDWVKEKAECPLCRQAVLPQKILPLR